MKWDHIGIKSSDVDRSLRFYTDILGLEMQEELEIMGKRFYFVGNDTVSIEIEAGNPGDTQVDPRTQTGYCLCRHFKNGHLRMNLADVFHRFFFVIINGLLTACKCKNSNNKSSSFCCVYSSGHFAFPVHTP